MLTSKGMFRPFVFCLLFGLISACTLNKEIASLKTRKPNGTIGIYDSKQIQKTDTYSYHGAVIGGIIDQNKMAIGLKGAVIPFNIGEFDYSMLLPFGPKVKTSGPWKKHAAPSPSHLKINFSGTYAFPIIKRMGSRENKIYLTDTNDMSTNSYTIRRVNYLDYITLRIGGGHYRQSLSTRAYAIAYETKYPERFYTSGLSDFMHIQQGSYVYKLGLSASRNFGTSFMANNRKTTYLGSFNYRFRVYVDFLSLLHHQTDLVPFEYSYLEVDGSNYSGIATADPLGFLVKKQTGFSFGFEVVAWSKLPKVRSLSAFLEVTKMPGYFPLSNRKAFATIGLTMGLGKLNQD